MKVTVFEKFLTLENVRGHYVMILPIVNVFPKKKTFREDYVSIHIGWIVWLLHIRLWFTPTKKDSK